MGVVPHPRTKTKLKSVVGGQSLVLVAENPAHPLHCLRRSHEQNSAKSGGPLVQRALRTGDFNMKPERRRFRLRITAMVLAFSTLIFIYGVLVTLKKPLSDWTSSDRLFGPWTAALVSVTAVIAILGE